MSLIDDFMNSIIGKIWCAGMLIVGVPLLGLVGYGTILIGYELIQEIEDLLWRDLTYALIFESCVIVFVVKTTYINWFRKHLWRLPELKDNNQ